MILTGKCKEDFLKSKYFPSNGEVYFNDLPESCKNALIIDFFDSVGIYIDPSKNRGNEMYNYEINVVINKIFESSVIKQPFLSKKEATIEAIKKANEIYNKNN